MNTAERRNEILNFLQNADEPVAARKLASQFGVSRQVIVQDMAVIRAATPGILSTTAAASVNLKFVMNRIRQQKK